MILTSTRHHTFGAARSEVWEAITQVRDYPAWWPWLREFDGAAMEPGATWRCTVQPPLPYALRFTLTIERVVEAECVDATLAGDLSGTANLALADDGEGCRVTLESRLSPQHGVLRAVATLAPPIARFGHDWVLDTGARQFVARALSRR